jgi:predicted HTH domain antitoxin
MNTVTLQIPEELLLSIKIPRKSLEVELKKELALQLYREGLASFANARRLALMSKIEFHYLLGERQILRQYHIEDYEKDLSNLDKWAETYNRRVK